MSSVDGLLGGNFSVLVIKLDHEVGLRRCWYQYRAKFRAGSFYDGPEAIRGQFRTQKSPKRFFEGREKFSGRDWVGSGCLQVEGVKPEAGEARRGTNKGHLDPKIVHFV